MRRRCLQFALLALLAAGCQLFSGPRVFVPLQDTPQKQYAYAVNFRAKNDLILRDTTDLPRLLRTRDAVRETFAKVVEYFPSDREVTPLARLEMADMTANLDVPRVKPNKRSLKSAIDALQKTRGDFPEFDYIQAKTRFDEGLCWKALGDFTKAQGLFKDVRDHYRDHKDKTIASIARMANYQYQRTYVE